MGATSRWQKNLQKLARKYSRVVNQSGSGHCRLDCIREERPPVFTSKSASCSRALKNVERDLKRNDKIKKETLHG